MLTPKNRLRPNGAEVAAKVLDGEAIMINLSNGMYYSMDKVGGLIWEAIEQGHSLEEIVLAVLSRYAVSREQAAADVRRLSEELIKENLVVVSDQPPSPQTSQGSFPQQKLTYEPPRLNIYRDMGDLLALDPPMPSLEEIPWKDSSQESAH
jgi:hypothetical protein